MAAPTIEFAYLNYARTAVIVVCHVDYDRLPLKVIALGTATNGWTVKKAGISQSIVGTVADPRPNCVTLTLDAALPVADTLTVEYDATTGDIADQSNVELTTTAAITVKNALPIIDLIARDIASRLGDITAANEFLFTLDVETDLKPIQTLAGGATWVSYEDPQPEEDAPINHEQFTAVFQIAIATSISTADSTPLTSKEYQIEGEVVKYLTNNQNYSRNNLAVDTIPMAPARVSFGDGGWGGIAVNLMVRFRTLYGNRFEQ